MKVRRQKLLEFYDHQPQWEESESSPVNAVTGMIGEDLVLALLCRKLGGKIRGYNCRGKKAWLDAWVTTSGAEYQVEVKNWCAHSLGGEKVEADRSNLRGAAEKNLKVYLEEPRNRAKIWKVLGAMKAVEGHSEETKPEPLLAFWAPVAEVRSTKLPSFFSVALDSYISQEIVPVELRETLHERVHIFSASLYLRHECTDEVLDLDMPRAEHRLKWLQSLLA
jgi:hypothetical protein